MTPSFFTLSCHGFATGNAFDRVVTPSGAYLLVSLHSQNLHNMDGKGTNESTDPVVSKWSEHQWWDFGQGWKNLLNNLRLVMQPYQFFNLLKPGPASFSNYAFINWLFNTNCLNESNARCDSREH
jgi:hypothetical protein